MLALLVPGKRMATQVAVRGEWPMSFRQLFSLSPSPGPTKAPLEPVGYPFPDGFIERLKLDIKQEMMADAQPHAAVGVQIGFESPRLSSFLLSNGVPVFALESNRERREAGRRHTSSWPAFQLMEGAPDATGLEDGAVDFIVSDRALYWPDQAEMRREFTRILRPGGVVALVTDNRVYSGGEQAQEFEQLLRKFCPSFREKRETHDIGKAVAGLFASGTVFEDAFTGEQKLTLAEFMEQNSCMPVFPGVDDPARAPLEAAMRKFFARWAKKGWLTIPTVCRVAFGKMDR